MPEPLRQRAGEAGDELARAQRGDRGDPLRADAPALHHLGGSRHQLVVEAPGLAARLHERVPAAVAEPRQRAALLGAHGLGDLAHRALGVGRHLLDLEHERARAQVQRRLAHELRIQRPVEARAGAHRAAPAVLRRRVVELLLQRAHQAAPVGAELRHRRLLAAAQRGDALVALGVVVPVAVRLREPARAVARDRALDVEHLEHRLDAALAEVDLGHQRLRRRAVARRPSRASTRSTSSRRGNACSMKKSWIRRSSRAAQEHHLGVLDRAPGTADLLVVGDHAAGRLVVHDEAEVGLVVAHAERARGDDRLEVVAQQPLLDRDAIVGGAVAAVGLGGDAVAAQPLRDQLGVALGERVDDPRAREVGQVLREPREAVGLAGQVDDLEAQARAPERAAVGAQRRRRGRCSAAPRRRRRRDRWRSPSCTAPARPRAAARACRRCGGSRGGSRGPSRRCSAPRRSPAGPTRSANSGSISARNCGLLSRSGLISSTSTASAASSSRTSAQASRLVELIVCARIPIRSAAAIWLRISASSGETISVGPAPASRPSAVLRK